MISFAASRARCAAGCFCFFLCGSVQVVGRCNRVAPRIPQRWDGGVAARGGVLPRWLGVWLCCVQLAVLWVGLGWVRLGGSIVRGGGSGHDNGHASRACAVHMGFVHDGTREFEYVASVAALVFHTNLLVMAPCMRSHRASIRRILVCSSSLLSFGRRLAGVLLLVPLLVGCRAATTAHGPAHAGKQWGATPSTCTCTSASASPSASTSGACCTGCRGCRWLQRRRRVR